MRGERSHEFADPGSRDREERVRHDVANLPGLAHVPAAGPGPRPERQPPEAGTAQLAGEVAA